MRQALRRAGRRAAADACRARRRRGGHSCRCGAGVRAARARGRAPRGPDPRTQCRHPAGAPVQGRQRCQGRPGAVPHRPGPLRSHAAECQGYAGTGRGQPDAGTGTAGALSPAGRRQCHQQAGLRQRRGRLQTGTGGCRCRQGLGAHSRDQPGLYQCDGTDFRPHRPVAGDRRRAGRTGRGDAAGRGPADQPGLCELHPVIQRSFPAAPRDGGRQAQESRWRRSSSHRGTP